MLQKQIRPERALLGSFLALIAVGTALLSLPVAASNGQSIGLLRGLFTATSAVCVSGMMVLDAAAAFSAFGQAVLLVLIQLGGLGLMIFATLIMALLGRRITLRDRVLIRESLSVNTLSGLVQISGWYGLMTLIIELAGAALLAVRFVPLYGWGRGAFMSVFHAVSAFCNAGFDLFGNFAGLSAFQRDPLVLGVIAALVILGGLGFSVMLEIISCRRGWRGMSLHCKLVIAATLTLLLTGTAAYALMEWNNPQTLGAQGNNAGTKLLNAFFLSASMRTAGFSPVDPSALSDAGKFFSVLMMFVGASPASTGGGVKTTTAAVLLLSVISVVRGREHAGAFGRRLPQGLMRRALAIVVIAVGALFACTMAIAVIEGGRVPFIDVLFDSAAVVFTTGMSAAGTASLQTGSLIVLMPMMLFGRLGPLTIALALADRMDRTNNLVKYPEENLMIG